MMIDQFVVQPPANIGAIIAVVALIVAGFVSILASSSKRLMNALPAGGYVKKPGQRFIHRFLAIGIILIVFGVALFGLSHNSYNPAPSAVNIYEGYMTATSEYFFARQPFNLPIKVNKAAFSHDIVTAFVGEIGSGDLKLQLQDGLAYGDNYVGRFTLKNGATAYVTTTNSTCLIIQVSNGDYIIVGTQDTKTLSNSFSQNIHALTKP